MLLSYIPEVIHTFSFHYKRQSIPAKISLLPPIGCGKLVLLSILQERPVLYRQPNLRSGKHIINT
jgi:hypothetical protein